MRMIELINRGARANFGAMESGVIHLLEASIKLECTIEVTARSLLLYHYFRRYTIEIIDNEDVIAATALHLSGRLFDEVIDLDSLICVFYSIVNQTTHVLFTHDQAYILLKKTLIHLEYMLIRMCEFDMNHRLAHQCLLPFLVMIFERSKNIADYCEELSATCIRFLSDFYTQPICLEFSPDLIAAACIDLGLHIHGLVNYSTMLTHWYMGFIDRIDPHKVRLIKKLMLSMYTKPILTAPPQPFLPIVEEQVEKTVEQATTALQEVLTIQEQ